MYVGQQLLGVLANVQPSLVEQAQQTAGTHWLITTVAFIAMLLVLVFVHELGHFVVAIWMKIKVDEFGIGYPPRALTLFQRNGVSYTLNWLPLGGFVRFAGEDNAVYGSGSLAEATPWQKIPVMLAGPLMNLVLAIIIFAALFAFSGIPTPIGQHIGEVYDNTPAAAASLQKDDIVLQMNNEPVLTSDDVSRLANEHKGEAIPITIVRHDETMTLSITPGAWTAPNGHAFDAGFGFSYGAEVDIQSASIPKAFITSILYTGEILVKMVNGLGQMVGSLFHMADAPSGGVAGPIGIARATGEIIDQAGAPGFWNWMAIISLNLFVLNLLPIPALDGSHIFFSLIEWVRGGKKVPPEKEAMVHAVGFIALMGLIVLVSVSDVINAVQGHSVLGG